MTRQVEFLNLSGEWESGTFVVEHPGGSATVEMPSGRRTTPRAGDWRFVVPDARFDGPEYVPERDHERLRGQLLRIFEVMRDGQWRSLADIERITGDPPASISAQLRHLRKRRFGSYTVNRRHVEGGLFEYQVVV